MEVGEATFSPSCVLDVGELLGEITVASTFFTADIEETRGGIRARGYSSCPASCSASSVVNAGYLKAVVLAGQRRKIGVDERRGGVRETESE